MNEPTVTPSVTGSQAGLLLRQAREQAGLHIEALAAILKVPAQRLSALEQGAYEALPDATFTRALALSVCRALKIDPAPVLAALPSGAAPSLTSPVGDLGAPMPRKAGTIAFADSPSGMARYWPIGLAVALCLMALVAWWLPSDWMPAPAAARALLDEQAQGLQERSGATASEVLPLPAAGRGEAAQGLSTTGVQTAAAVVSPAAVPASQPSGLPALTSSQAGSADAHALVLRTSATSWIQVTGSSGRVWLQRNVQPGETLRFDDDLPLSVVVGRSDATMVEVRGQLLDLNKLARNNVARFEVR